MILSWPFGDVHQAEIFSMSTSIIDVDVKYIWHCTLYPLLKVKVADMTCVTILKGWRRSKQGPRASECPLFEANTGTWGCKMRSTRVFRMRVLRSTYRKLKSKGAFGDKGFKDNGMWSQVQRNIWGQGFKSWQPVVEGHNWRPWRKLCMGVWFFTSWHFG